MSKKKITVPDNRNIWDRMRGAPIEVTVPPSGPSLAGSLSVLVGLAFATGFTRLWRDEARQAARDAELSAMKAEQCSQRAEAAARVTNLENELSQ